jgi:hypothetical protein
VTCAFARALSNYVDAELPLREMARMRDHLDVCKSCAAGEASLRRLTTGLRQLPPVPPPERDLWGAIAGELDQGAVRAAARARTRRRLGRVAFTLPPLMMAAGAALWFWHARHPAAVADGPHATAALLADAEREFGAAENHYAQAAADLRKLCERERSRWPSEVAQTFDDNLAAIDAALLRSRAAAEARAESPALREHLLVAYRRKIEFLEEAIHRGAAAGREVDPL